MRYETGSWQISSLPGSHMDPESSKYTLLTVTDQSHMGVCGPGVSVRVHESGGTDALDSIQMLPI